ncbi:MBL fold metallo-hydrolase [Nonomuraea sp. NPDC050536]|uniref:MBL fold metallo-hydrolase n=1 Tax=Nonomuraea sp. NPDC050536 TaxID=3364366 RepID=UPI0037CBCFE9
MKLTILGGSGAWPTATQACSGYLVEHDGYRILIDPGYGTMQVLQEFVAPEDVDAVVVTHGHPDHCADLNPLLRARVLGERGPAPLAVHAPEGALDAVLTLDRPGMLADGLTFSGELGPFRLETWLLPHHVPNHGVRLSAGGTVLAYTGDTGPTPDLVDLARDADVFLAEATYPDEVPEEDAPYLSTARQAGENAARAGVGRLILTHPWPGLAAERFVTAAAEGYSGTIGISSPRLIMEL